LTFCQGVHRWPASGRSAVGLGSVLPSFHIIQYSLGDYGATTTLSTRHPEPSILNILEIAGISMPLTPGRILGYDNERMAFGFSMLNGSEEVECQISAAAIDELVGGPRGTSVDRGTQFSLLRETIESLASTKFDTSPIVRGSVLRIFAKDI
jgi:Protein of unknown function (DUF1488)